MQTRQFDIVVMGAGTAGAAAAAFLAQAGRSVALVDARTLGTAGARWVNGVPPWMFDAAGVERPVAPERRAVGAFVMTGIRGRARIRLDPSPVWAVDMRLLVARLQAMGSTAGVEAFAPARLGRVDLADGRPRALSLRLPEGEVRLEADLFIDASGLSGVLRRQVPLLARDCPAVSRDHLCTAAQYVYRVADPAGAAAHLAAADVRMGDTLCRAGVSGGYSIANLTVDHDEVEILTGAIARPPFHSGPALIAALRRSHPWIGDPLFGGASAIPLRRPYDRLGAPGVALLGNAACQVFSAHGSGIGVGLLAARMLADTVAGASDPGDRAVVWSYQAAFHRRLGPLLAAYDLFRRRSQSFDGAEVERLFEAGLLSEDSYRAGLLQRLPVPDVREMAATLRAALRSPLLTARMAPTFARFAPAVALYRRAPDAPDDAALARWSRRVAKVFDEPPDLMP